MTGAPLCQGCGAPAAFVAGHGPDAIRACAVCREDDGGAGLELGGWSPLETAEDAARRAEENADRHNRNCGGLGRTTTEERIASKPYTCGTCNRAIRPGDIHAAAVSGAGSSCFTLRFCLGRCVPVKFEPVERMGEARCWAKFKACVAKARSPEDVPPAWFERFASVPF